MKRAYVILAFHAHEPLWDLPNELIALVDDPEIHDAIRGENYVLKRAREDSMILTMYQHLYEIYPPKFPQIFKELFPEEWKARENPRLL